MSSYVGMGRRNILKRNSWTIPSDMPADLGMLCLWTVFGLAVTALVFALGFGPEVVQALATAG
jgi:hypothetical protein